MAASNLVLRVDDKVKSSEDLNKLKPRNVATEEWQQFISRIKVTDLYYELVF